MRIFLRGFFKIASMYKLYFTNKAKADLKKLGERHPSLVGKVAKLLDEITEHPRSGTGQCERLKYTSEETWSRRMIGGIG